MDLGDLLARLAASDFSGWAGLGNGLHFLPKKDEQPDSNFPGENVGQVPVRNLYGRYQSFKHKFGGLL